MKSWCTLLLREVKKEHGKKASNANIELRANAGKDFLVDVGVKF